MDVKDPLSLVCFPEDTLSFQHVFICLLSLVPSGSSTKTMESGVNVHHVYVRCFHCIKMVMFEILQGATQVAMGTSRPPSRQPLPVGALLQANHCPGSTGGSHIIRSFPHGFIVLGLLVNASGNVYKVGPHRNR